MNQGDKLTGAVRVAQRRVARKRVVGGVGAAVRGDGGRRLDAIRREKKLTTKSRKSIPRRMLTGDTRKLKCPFLVFEGMLLVLLAQHHRLDATASPSDGT